MLAYVNLKCIVKCLYVCVVFGDPEPCYVATLTLVRRRAEGPPPSTGEGVSLTPPYALKLMIDFDSLIMVKLYCLVPPPFPGMGDHYCPI